MKAISIWQPWASLLFAPVGFRKVYETRPRRMGFVPGDRVLIHASKTDKGLSLWPQMPESDRRYFRESLSELFADHIAETGDLIGSDLPRGCLLGSVEIVGMIDTDSLKSMPRERAFGDWRPGRVAIKTTNPVLFDEPIPYRGQQGVFYVPDNVISEAVTNG